MKYHSIAISGLPGSGKSGLARKLSETLGWPVRSIGDIWRERHREQKISLPFEIYWKNTSILDNIKINNEFLELVNSGNIIADTRYVHIYGVETFKVFMTAPVVTRALRALGSSKYSGKSCQDIEQILEAREKDEVLMGRKIWGDDYDYKAEEHYDLILNSGINSIEQEHSGILKEIGY